MIFVLVLCFAYRTPVKINEKIRSIGFMKTFLFALLTIIMLFSCGWFNRELTGYDVELFKGDHWKLAKAVDNEDTARINKLLQSGKFKVDFQEQKFGISLLHWAVFNGKNLSVKPLLENGADPNLQDTYDGSSAFMEACKFGINYDRDTEILKLLLAFGGDPNSEEKGPRRQKNKTRNTPLILAAHCCFEKVKLLVEAGADIDYRTEFGGTALNSASNGANEKLKILHYLVIEKKADTSMPLYTTLAGKDVYLSDDLLKIRWPEDKDKQKLLIDLLKYVNGKSDGFLDSLRIENSNRQSSW